eukprot:gnl/TRDRNA2_/TRDRNA2_181276_c0_seq1.p1 gnl/TRDRNA2_/TRDRNA2_181276_c0~~gnl/TRDRNA2_/TRDRNA2_181276_c0_seq1.p1  ORF type:complete len:264 (+),score=63.58 gnl/TRDRNA2_/TRDRNA2_181276_c0_seq1:50-841(+)
MVGYATALAIFALCVSPTAGALLRAVPDATKSDDGCKYGYGDGCENFWDETPDAPAQKKPTIDKATRDKVANILGGILKGLSKTPVSLQAISEDVAHGYKVAAPENKQVRRALGSLLTTMRRKSKTGAAIVGRLTGQQVEESSAASVATVLAGVTSSGINIPDCPFGYGCGGGGRIDSATRTKVAGILKGMIKTLSGGKGHRKPLGAVQMDGKVRRALSDLHSALERQGKPRADALSAVSELAGVPKVDDAAGLTAALSTTLQ